MTNAVFQEVISIKLDIVYQVSTLFFNPLFTLMKNEKFNFGKSGVAIRF